MIDNNEIPVILEPRLALKKSLQNPEIAMQARKFDILRSIRTNLSDPNTCMFNDILTASHCKVVERLPRLLVKEPMKSPLVKDDPNKTA